MKPIIVYLHIPKPAGTSYRYYFARVYGKENVFWYGLDGNAWWFKPTKVASMAVAVAVAGGNKTLNFYHKKFDALYTAVIRDPFERVISYFISTPRPGVSLALHGAWNERNF